VTLRSLRPIALPLFVLAWPWKTASVEAATRLVAEAADTSQPRELNAVLADHFQVMRTNPAYLARWLGVRVSSRRLIRIFREVQREATTLTTETAS
jgi:hypothetical protein